MSEDIRHDAAKAAAYVAWELFESSPGASEAAMLEQLTEIISLAIGETERRTEEERRFTCPFCLHSHQVMTHQTPPGPHFVKPGHCPKCKRVMLAPEQVRSN